MAALPSGHYIPTKSPDWDEPIPSRAGGYTHPESINDEILAHIPKKRSGFDPLKIEKPCQNVERY
jgi:hypothetical protein